MEPKRSKPFTAFEIKALPPKDKTYRQGDGRSLFVVVYPSGKKSYEFRYRRGGVIKSIVIKAKGIADARIERDRYHAMLTNGLDPIAQRRINAEQQRKELTEARRVAADRRAAAKKVALTVKVVGDEWFNDSKQPWKAKHTHQVEQSLRDHVYPTLGKKLISDVEPADVLNLLGKMLAEGKVETVRRVHQRLDAIFEFASLKYKLPSNPVAVAKREIGKRVKAARKVKPEVNFACVPEEEIQQLLRAMRSYGGTPVTRSLLWFVALTGCRTGEARHSTWEEFDLERDDPCWVIAKGRMKAGREHWVPLAPVVVGLLRQLRELTGHRQWVFTHPKKADRPVSENAILYALSALGYKDRMTGHGFRSMFSTLANESGLHRPDVIETALAHTEGDDVRRAYNRATYQDERRRLSNWYADELARREAGLPAKVVAITKFAA